MRVWCNRTIQFLSTAFLFVGQFAFAQNGPDFELIVEALTGRWTTKYVVLRTHDGFLEETSEETWTVERLGKWTVQASMDPGSSVLGGFKGSFSPGVVSMMAFGPDGGVAGTIDLEILSASVNGPRDWYLLLRYPSGKGFLEMIATGATYSTFFWHVGEDRGRRLDQLVIHRKSTD